uniref:Plastid lipid-associated protein/fibrillin conserved domain-containing protein n=1 Tax=Pseudo-nitzschia arenysensis TaxID=697910 RepID=A0A7S0F811_9STRA|mmetsp:Transcript_987/g.2285  ORF Transcript_987/g.2285 Transcript_987/m.2285 type:complete len:316 (+) Transcript_987:128-1075(+)
MTRILSAATVSALVAASFTANAFTTINSVAKVGPHGVATSADSLIRVQSMPMDDDSPSDTSSDPFYDDDEIVVESEEFTSTESEVLVTSVFDLIPDSVGLVPSEEKRAEINEVLLKLEALNPTPQPATSPLLNGVWELNYAGLYSSEGSLSSPTRQLALFLYSGGYSPGLFTLQLAKQLPSNLVDIVGPPEITISREAPRVEGQVTLKTLLGGESSTKVKSNLEVVSDIRLRETYESATVLGGQVVDLPGFMQYTRDIYVTYLDEDLLVIRDGSGVPELLIRKEKSFTRNWGDEPTTVDDSLAPGEEDESESSVL